MTTVADSVELVLASASPRRRDLLARLGLTLRLAPANIDESPQPGEPAPVHALRVARQKAEAVAKQHPDRPVLAADTVVVLAGAILGKPRDRADAATMLRALAGRAHLVITAMAVLWRGKESSTLATARVRFVPYQRELFEWYVQTGEGDDKAGGYAVQGRGALLVERVEGNVQAVVGLPLAPLPALLAGVGLSLVANGDSLTVRPLDVTRCSRA
jgi:septum formation protein